MVEVPSLNVTVPVGVAAPVVWATMAVYVTDWLTTDGLAEEETEVVVPTAFTTLTGLLAPLVAVQLPYTAVTV